jgi:NADPH:quinone reductase-like Zn-dependent oxidoreductase
VVEAVGPGVTRFVEGDEVFGVTNPNFTGGYADFAIATAAMLGNKPAMLPHIDAASVPVVAVTACQALFEQAGLTPGQSVLVLGAAGNVGAFAVQRTERVCRCMPPPARGTSAMSAPLAPTQCSTVPVVGSSVIFPR